MIRHSLQLLACTIGVGMSFSQAPGTSAPSPLPEGEFPIWPDGAPGALGTQASDIPTLTPYFPAAEATTGAAMIVCPGGGYGALAPHEGEQYARWLNEAGVAAFVLKYRLGSHGYRHPAMLNDAQRAIRHVRSHAGLWQLDPNKIGVMGSSAGGHLAATALTHYDAGRPDADDPVERAGCRPDLGILCYPVITMGAYSHAGSRKNLLGELPDPVLIDLLSNEKQVTRETPPVFLFHTADDAAVPVENSLEFAAALRRNGVPFALHVYPHGVHGIGLGSSNQDSGMLHPWTTQCLLWLREAGFAR